MATSLVESVSRLTRTPAFKFFLICGLILLLTIPLALIWFLVSEREGRFNEVKAELAQVFGGEQRIFGPFLIVPYTVRVVRGQYDKQIEDAEQRYAVFLPADFIVNV